MPDSEKAGQSPAIVPDVTIHITGVEEAIEDERLRLQKALYLLECLIFSMSYKEECTSEELRDMDHSAFAGVAELVRDTVNEAISNLDSVAMERCAVIRGLTGLKADRGGDQKIDADTDGSEAIGKQQG